MVDNQREDKNLEHSGVTGNRSTPFDNLVSYRNNFELTQEFINQWVIPYYMHIGYTDEHWVLFLEDKSHWNKEIKTDVLEKRLAVIEKVRNTGN